MRGLDSKSEPFHRRWILHVNSIAIVCVCIMFCFVLTVVVSLSVSVFIWKSESELSYIRYKRLFHVVHFVFVTQANQEEVRGNSSTT